VVVAHRFFFSACCVEERTILVFFPPCKGGKKCESPFCTAEKRTKVSAISFLELFLPPLSGLAHFNPINRCTPRQFLPSRATSFSFPFSLLPLFHDTAFFLCHRRSQHMLLPWSRRSALSFVLMRSSPLWAPALALLFFGTPFPSGTEPVLRGKIGLQFLPSSPQ